MFADVLTHGIVLWNVYGDCKNIGVLSGHKGPVLDLNWGRDGKLLYSASADQSACVWDLSEMQRIKKIKGHTSYVNCITPSRRGDPLCVTGSDDCTAMVWDIRRKNHVYKFDNEYQVLGACFSDDSSQVFTAGIDEKIHCWDLRTEKKLYSLTGHTNTITGISLSADGSYIVSNSRDQTVRTWDVRPYVSQGKSRMVGVYEGASHDFQELMLR